jgi:hypothetical protein
VSWTIAISFASHIFYDYPCPAISPNMDLINSIVTWFYRLIQRIIARVFSPHPPERHHRLPGPRIAVIGAGIIGVSSAAHCIGHGFEVQIFEAGDQDHLGGIWSVRSFCISYLIDRS